jgi:hypothetical protein
MDRTMASLDYALVILLIRINGLLSSVNSISPFLLAPFCSLFVHLGAPSLSCSELGVEVLILFPKDLHGFCHKLQELHQLRVVGCSESARRGLQWVC